MTDRLRLASRQGGPLTIGAVAGNRLSWKAAEEARHPPFPGDDLVPSPVLATTRAVAINAPPEQVWPWLAQTGQARAGSYSGSRFWDRPGNCSYRLLSRE